MGVDIKLTGVPDFSKLELVKVGNVSTIQYDSANPGAGNFNAEDGVIATVNHNLGYTPIMLAYLEDSDTFFQLPYEIYGDNGGTQAYWVGITPQVDSTSLIIEADVMVYGAAITIGAGFNIKYFLLKYTAN